MTTLTLSFVAAAVCHATLPDMQNVAKPSPEPGAQSGWDVFSPPVANAAALSPAPMIAEWTRTGAPNDSLILTGEKFSRATGADEGKDTQFLTYGQTTAQNAVQLTASIQRLDGLMAAVTLPAGLPAWSTYLLWPKNSSGYGYPVAVNKTEAWWLNPDDRVSRGDTVSVFGRNLSHGGGTTTSWVYIKPPGTVGQWSAVTSVNPYRVQFRIPDSLANGTYEVWVHNGHGGSYGWSGPLTLTVADPYLWNGGVFNVKKYGATGDGATDDTNAVHAAYSAAAQYRDQSGLHPTLYFPAGTYLMRYGLGLEHDFRFLGDGKESTILRCSAKFNQPRQQGDGLKLGLLFANGGVLHNIEVKDLTLDADGHFGRPTNLDHLVFCQFEPGTSDLRFTNVRVKILVPGIGCAFFNSITRLSLVGCEFIGGDIMLFNGNQHAVSGCSFLGANDSGTAIIQRGTSHLSVTNCSSADFDINSPTGQGLGRFIAGNGDYGTQRHVYIGDNTTVDCGPRIGAADQNSGEQVMCEGNSNQFEGTPSSATGTTVTFSDLAADYTGQTAIVSGGKGLGQHRLISGYDRLTKTIRVSPAWNVVPDATSVLLIAHAADRWVIYHNNFDGKDDYAARYSATAAIQPFGGSYDWVGDSNTISNMRIALYVVGLEQTYPITGIGPCYFNYYANNFINACHRGIHVVACGIPAGMRDDAVGVLGNVFRNNRLTEITSTGANLYTNEQATAGPSLDMTLFEHNTFKDLPVGIDFDELTKGSQVKNTLWIKNRFERGTAPFSSSVGVHFAATTLAPVFSNNSWDGFERNYTGELSDAARVAVIRAFVPQTPVGSSLATNTISVSSGIAASETSQPASPAVKLRSLSARSFVGTGDDVLIAGFIIAGSAPIQVLIRASGPALTPLGVPGVLADPILTLYAGQTVLKQNDDWSSDDASTPLIEAAATRTGAFTWIRGTKDAALLITLSPGNYSARVAGKDGGTGFGLIEIYEADPVPVASQLVSLSSRAETGSGANVPIAGFVIRGATSKKVLIRASGPALAQFGLSKFLDDPVLTLFSGQTVLNRNDDWSSDPAGASVVETAATAAGAFPWPRGGRDAALVVTLPPGAYTAQVSGKNSATGVSLIEIYEVP